MYLISISKHKIKHYGYARHTEQATINTVLTNFGKDELLMIGLSNGVQASHSLFLLN